VATLWTVNPQLTKTLFHTLVVLANLAKKTWIAMVLSSEVGCVWPKSAKNKWHNATDFPLGANNKE
jgi:hypothetical protein